MTNEHAHGHEVNDGHAHEVRYPEGSPGRCWWCGAEVDPSFVGL